MCYSGHCKKIDPEYKAAASILAEKNQYIAKVDATENKNLAERFEVKGFPTLHWFVNGNRQDYTGGRTTDTIVSWINKKTGPPSDFLECEQVTTKTADAKLNLVYFGDLEGDMYNTFITVAKETDGMMFYHAPASCAAAHGAQAGSLAFFRTFDESPLHYSGAADAAAIKTFAEESSVPTLIDFSEDYIEPIFGKGKDAIIFFSNDKDSAYHTVFAEAAKSLKGEILFVQSGTKDGIQARLAEFVGVDDSATPCVRVLAPGEEMKKYAFPSAIESMSTESLKTFIADIRSGAVKPHLKSEPIPEQTTGAYVVVGNSFEDVVMDSTKDVLVKYYAPWCGHCKKLAPVWDELADSYAGVEDLVIAKFDATTNEVAGLQISGYPTLKWYPKDDKSGKTYEGDRELEDFKNFLSENSSAAKAHKEAGNREEL
jgi:protein disulfide-isomerase A1